MCSRRNQSDAKWKVEPPNNLCCWVFSSITEVAVHIQSRAGVVFSLATLRFRHAHFSSQATMRLLKLKAVCSNSAVCVLNNLVIHDVYF